MAIESEILESYPAAEAPQKGSDSTSADIDRAVSIVAAQGWMQARTVRETYATLSANELTSLSALIAYIAHNSGEHEFRVERRLADHFNIPNVMCLASHQYDDAIRYLVDPEDRGQVSQIK